MKLHNYQERAIQFWLAHPRCYFAIDMGLGKTALTLAALSRLKKPALIIAPLRTLESTWVGEIKKWGLDLRPAVIHGKNKKAALHSKADVFITNFESIPFIYDELAELSAKGKPMPFEVLVIDEGSMVKSSSTKRFKYLKSLKAIFPKYRCILSGTPAPNTLLDLWSQYYLLTDGDALGKTYYGFRRKYYNNPPWQPYTFEIKEGAEQKIFDAIKPYTFRLDAEDYLNMPEITYNYIDVPLPVNKKRAYSDFEKEFRLEIHDIECTAVNAASLSMKLRQFLQGFLYTEEKTIRVHDAKIKALKSLVEETDTPILCAIQFKEEIAMIREAFPDTPLIAGGVKADEANKIIRDWNEGKIPLLLCHPASISHGVNLQSGGSIVLWYCCTWSLEQYQQFNARLYRQGQTKNVIVNHLVVAGTIDAKVAKVLKEKDFNQRKLLDYLREEI